MADTNLLILAREFKKLRTHVQEVLKMPVGPQGLQGEKGEQGVKGDTGAPGKDGKDGKDGVNGLNGQDGRNGADGKDGKDGLDGVGVQNAYIDFDNSLVIVLTSGQEINAGFLSQETKDAVVATFKQGAQTLNELLPVQTGNANKFLKTDGENVSWDTLDGSDINLASPPVIGNTTPNAATFTTLTATGQTSLGGAAGSEGLRVLTPIAAAGLRLQAGVPSSTVVRLGPAGSAVADFRIIAPTFTNFYTGSSADGLNDGAAQMRVSHTASAVNYVQVTGAATGSGNFPTISSQGSDAAVNLRLSAKGTSTLDAQVNSTTRWRINADGSVDSGISASGGVSFKAAATGSQVNYLQSAGGPTNFEPVLSAQGSDTNISMAFQSKGTGAIDLAAGSSGVNISNGTTVTAITRTAAGSGYTTIPALAISAPTTAGGVQATAAVTAMVVNTVAVSSGGTGYTVGDVLTVSGGTVAPAQLSTQVTVSTVSAGVITAVTVSRFGTYSVLPTNPSSVTGGTGSGATFDFTYAISGAATNFTITNAGSGYVEQPTVTFSGGGGGSGAAAVAQVGAGVSLRSLGGGFSFFTPTIGTTQGEAFRVYDFGGATWVGVRGHTGPTSPAVFSAGSANVGLDVVAQGSGSVALRTGGSIGSGGIFNQLTQLQASHTASAVNYVQVTGAATTGLPTISAQGSDTNPGLLYITKGVGEHRFASNASAANIQFRIPHTASAVNYGTATGAVAGSAPIFSVAGSDTNIDLALTPKGTGLVRFGTRTASADAPITGYIEIKDSGGTVRRLAVIG